MIVVVEDKALRQLISEAVADALQKIKPASPSEYNISREEAARFLGMSKDTLDNKRGEIGFIKNGRKVQFRMQDLEEYNRKNYVPK